MNFEVRFVLTLFVAVIDALPDFCKLPCNKAKNVGCKHPGWSNQCPPNKTLITIDKKLQDKIVGNHNYFRNFFAGGKQKNFSAAVSMNFLKWDSTLAHLASLNVKQCAMAHDTCLKTDKFEYTGQNLYFSAQTNAYPDITKAVEKGIKAWYDEYSRAQQSDLTVFKRTFTSTGVIGHFTQMVKDKTKFVGCGVSKYFKGIWYYVLFACNYSYGNMLNEPVYVAGKAASKCKKTSKPDHPFLCAH